LVVVENANEPNTDPLLNRLNIDPTIGLTIDAPAFVVIPLRVANRQIGAIWISCDKPHRFSETDRRVFQSFGEQASLSLDAAILFEQTNRRAQQLETSAQVSNAAGQILDLDTLLPQIVDLVRDSFKYDHAQIFLMDEHDEYAELRASTGDAGRQLLNIRHKLRKGSESVIGRVTETNRAVIAQDTSHQGVVHAPNPYLPETRSEMALPLVLKGRVIGALDVQSNQINAFTREDIAALTTLAAQISVAIDNANLYQAAQDQADRMGLLFEVTTAAAAAGTLRDALQRVSDNLYGSLGVRTVAVYLKREYQDHLGNAFATLEVDALSGFEVENDDVLRVRLSDRGGGALGQAARKQSLMLLNDLQIDTSYRPIAPGSRSAVLVPLVRAGALLGMIALEGQRPNQFDNDTIQLLQTLSGSLTAVVQNGQLLERLTKANDELREMDRLKSDFLANMSHELRTPLNSIIGFSRMMLKGMSGPLNDMQEADLGTIFGSGQHLLTVINDILDQAKIAAGKMTISIEQFDVKPEIEAVRSIGIGLVKDKPIDLRVDIANNLPLVYGDKVRVRQVLLNLVSNASKFTRQGSVTIRAYALDHGDSKMVHIDVTDSGIGIAMQDMDLLFEPFRQVDSSLTRTAGGTGLGLPIARSLMQLMGGELTVQSEVNVGSTFTVTIPTEPVEDKPEEEAPALPAAPLPRAALPVTGPLTMPPMPVELKRQIVVVEDNPDMVDQFRRILQREGWEIIVCGSSLEARAVVPAMQPTMVLMDVAFDDGTGWELLDEFASREDTSHMPIIVATLSEERDRAMDKGAFAFLQRPYSPDVLTEAVNQAAKQANVPRILIIDDQHDALRLLGELLREQGGFNIYTASSGMEGLQQVAFRHPNLIILDLRMPEMDGFAVLRELRENPETQNIPVMVVTSDTTLRDDEREQLQAVRVLPKAEISETDYHAFLKGVKENLGRSN
jgi:signal transduction histidine kinase/DNA-binding response OmpR family regulator